MMDRRMSHRFTAADENAWKIYEEWLEEGGPAYAKKKMMEAIVATKKSPSLFDVLNLLRQILSAVQELTAAFHAIKVQGIVQKEKFSQGDVPADESSPLPLPTKTKIHRSLRL